MKRNNLLRTLSCAGALALLSVACGGGDDAPPLDPAAVSAGKALFTAKGCVACHGEKGDGDTPTGKNLTPPPRNYTDPKWQKETTDETIRKVILEGGAANGMSASMVSYRKMVTDEEVLQLVAFIRSLGR